MTDPRIVWCEWVGSWSRYGWQDLERVSDLSIKTIGFLVDEDEDSVTISASMSANLCSSPMTIPKVSITALEDVELVKPAAREPKP